MAKMIFGSSFNAFKAFVFLVAVVITAVTSQGNVNFTQVFYSNPKTQSYTQFGLEGMAYKPHCVYMYHGMSEKWPTSIVLLQN